MLDKGRISLNISTEVSQTTSENAFFQEGGVFEDPDTGELISQQGLQVPALTVRRAEATVELPSGGSMVLAGLLQQELRQNIDGLPGIKDVPVLGPLFRSRDFINDETELVIIVTPYLVEPTTKDKLTSPTKGLVVASDLQSFLLGKLISAYGVSGAMPDGQALQGPIGFILD